MGDGTPTSQNKSTSGDKCDCPLQTHTTCHVKKLKVTTIYKDRGSLSSEGAEKLKLLKSSDKPPDGATRHELEASLTNNRIVKPIQDAAKKKHYQDQVTNGQNAVKQSVKDAGAQTKQAVKQTIDNRSLKGVQGPTGPTAEQKKAMGEGVNAAIEITHARILNVWDRKIFERLQRYDIVINTMASFYGDSNASFSQGGARSVNTVDIKIEVDAEGECPTQSHDYVTIKPLSYTGNQSVKTTPMPKGKTGGLFKLSEATWNKKTRTILLEDVMAPSIDADVNTASNPLTGIIKVLRMGFAFLDPMELELRLMTCGKKDRATLDPPDLAALIRIFRETSIAVGFKIPPFKKFEKTSAQFKNETSTTSNLGLSKTTSTTYKHPKSTRQGGTETEAIEEFDFYIKLNDVELSLNAVKEMREKELPEALAGSLVAIRQAFNQATNQGAPPSGELSKMSAAQKANTLLPYAMGAVVIAAKIYRVWKAADFVASLIGVMEKFPQCGFKITVEWSFLEGLFEMSLSTGSGKEYETSSAILAAANKRYISSGWKGKIGIAATIISGKIEASFGLLIDFSVIGRVEARVVGTLAGAVEYKAEAEFSANEGLKAASGPSGKITGRLHAVAALETWVKTWKYEIGIEAGLQLDSGIEWSGEGTKVKAKLKTMPVQWYFVAVNGRTAVEDAKLYVLYESQTVWEVDENVGEKKS